MRRPGNIRNNRSMLPKSLRGFGIVEPIFNPHGIVEPIFHQQATASQAIAHQAIVEPIFRGNPQMRTGQRRK